MGALIEKNVLKLSIATTIVVTGLIGCANPYHTLSGVESSGQIIGGREATGSEDFSKTIVSLYDVSQGTLCTASILSDSILLTAAHCVVSKASDLRVIFAVDLEAKDLMVRGVEDYRVSPIWEARQNEMYNTGDIAIVKFVGGLPPGYKAAELLTDLNLLADGQKTVLAGYGLSNGVEKTGLGRLRFVETTIMKRNYSKTEILVDQRQGKGACHGDSGGPAYAKVGGKLLVWGVTSRGVNDPANDCSVAAAYTSVPYYAAWIERAAQLLNSSTRSAKRSQPAKVARM
jgi:secreted trypsin-like serine protease